MNFTQDDLIKLRRIVATAGLLKAFDGVKWIDLRLVIQDLISDTESLHAEINDLREDLSDCNLKLKRITDPDTYHD